MNASTIPGAVSCTLAMTKLWWVGLSALMPCLSLTPRVEGAMLTYILEGTITQKTNENHLPDILSVGDKVTYTVLVDSETPSHNSTPGFGAYDAASAHLEIAGEPFACNPPWIQIIADWSDNPTSMFSVLVATSFSGWPVSGIFQLTDYQKESVSDAHLPVAPYDLRLFEHIYFSWSVTNPDVYGDYSYVIGSFDSFTIIPEPASLCLFALACAFIRTRSVRRL